MKPDLPASVRVVVRGWLNCNSIVLLSPGDNVVVDSGYCSHREETIELLASRAGLDRQPLERLVNTHCHSDHMGGNAALASAFGCRVTIPAAEAKNIRPWAAQLGALRRFGQRADPFDFDDTLAPGDTFEAGGFAWRVHAAPGHDMDALMFFEPTHRMLISGDALWENGMGFVWPAEGAKNPFIEAARETLATIERLDPAVVLPGHGTPFHDARGSVARVRSRLDAFERDPVRCARHMLKVMFAFALLERHSMPRADVAGYLASVPCYPEVSAGFLGLGMEELAGAIVGDLARAGAVAEEGGTLRSTLAA